MAILLIVNWKLIEIYFKYSLVISVLDKEVDGVSEDVEIFWDNLFQLENDSFFDLHECDVLYKSYWPQGWW